MDTRSKHVVMKAVDGKTSGWLNVLPTARHLSAVVFRDALAMRYCWPFLRMPSSCDGCGAQFSLQNTLDYIRKAQVNILLLFCFVPFYIIPFPLVSTINNLSFSSYSCCCTVFFLKMYSVKYYTISTVSSKNAYITYAGFHTWEKSVLVQ